MNWIIFLSLILLIESVAFVVIAWLGYSIDTWLSSIQTVIAFWLLPAGLYAYQQIREEIKKNAIRPDLKLYFKDEASISGLAEKLEYKIPDDNDDRYELFISGDFSIYIYNQGSGFAKYWRLEIESSAFDIDRESWKEEPEESDVFGFNLASISIIDPNTDFGNGWEETPDGKSISISSDGDRDVIYPSEFFRLPLPAFSKNIYYAFTIKQPEKALDLKVKISYKIYCDGADGVSSGELILILKNYDE